MNSHFSFKHMEPSDTLRGYAEEKSERLAKYFHGRVTLTWSFSVEKQNRVVRCHLVGNQMDYFAETAFDDFLASVDGVIDKIERQIRRHKEIVKDHLHRQSHRLPQAS